MLAGPGKRREPGMQQMEASPAELVGGGVVRKRGARAQLVRSAQPLREERAVWEREARVALPRAVERKASAR
jgi:hypothetical protein